MRSSRSGTYLESGIIVPSINDALEFKLGNIVIKDSTVAESGRSGCDDYSVEYSQVMDLLQSLKIPIQELLRAETQDGVLRVPLGRVRPLSFDGKFFDPQRVHVLQLEPHEGPETETLKSICRMAFNAFKNAGMFVAPPAMAPHLATTLINTKNRARHQGLPAAQRPKSQKRIPFNLEALYASEFFRELQGLGPESNPLDPQQPISVDLGMARITMLCLRRVAMPTETKDLIHDGKIDLAG
ncbi:hypothetical protein JB92DRAFT_2209703 [Gautieria morchelliformis]|nr:hypothetical protein JB92DRAFT_2209703 [Gautieria morchelliformis]